MFFNFTYKHKAYIIVHGHLFKSTEYSDSKPRSNARVKMPATPLRSYASDDEERQYLSARSIPPPSQTRSYKVITTTSRKHFILHCILVYLSVFSPPPSSLQFRLRNRTLSTLALNQHRAKITKRYSQKKGKNCPPDNYCKLPKFLPIAG
jgi:hypothetical protein